MKRLSRPCFTALRGIQGLLLLTLVLIGIVPIGSVGLGIAMLERQTVAEHSSRELTGLARGLAGQIDLYLNDILGDTRAFASMPDVVTMDPSRQSAFLQTVYFHYPQFARISAFDRDGRRLASSHADGVASIASSEPFRAAVARGQETWSVGPSRSTGRRAFLVNVPIRHTERGMVGVLGAVIDLESLSRLVGRVAVGDGGRAYVLDASGRIVLHPDPNAVRERHDYSWTGVVNGAPPAGPGTVRYERDGESLVAGYATVSDFGWTVFVEQPEAVLLAHAEKSWRVAAAGVAICAILACLVAIFLARRFTRPLRELAAAAQAFADGDADAPLPRVGRADGEIGTLVSAFSQMRETVPVALSLMQASEERFRRLAENAQDLIYRYEVSAPPGFSYVSPAAAGLTGYSPDELYDDPDRFISSVHADDRPVFEAMLAGKQISPVLTLRFQRKDGHLIWAEQRGVPVYDGDGKLVAVEGVVRDVTERVRAEEELRQAQKLESVGRLAAGIAHEINTPIQFVGDNVRFVRDSITDLDQLMEKYQALRDAASAGQVAPELLNEVAEAEEQADLEYAQTEIPKALNQTLDGVARVATIVRAMKDFAHPDQKEKVASDQNDGLQSTLTVARNELKYVADVETDFGDLPAVRCRPGELNQVFLNLPVNAAHAIADTPGQGGRKGVIRVRTWRENDNVVVAISDNGCGIPDDIRPKVFDQFFTTKQVGRGTGQGLALVRAIVVEQHAGSVTFESEVGQGTTFFVRLPIDGPLDDSIEVAA